MIYYEILALNGDNNPEYEEVSIPVPWGHIAGRTMYLNNSQDIY